jgi:hypothetical protein
MNPTFVTVVILLVILWLHRRARAGGDDVVHPPRAPHKPYPAASIRCQAGACKAVRDLRRQRFLAWEAPNIPVPECDAEACRCRYVCYDDRRRKGGDRRSPFGVSGTGHITLRDVERRQSSDRREARAPGSEPDPASDFDWSLNLAD